MRVRAAWRGYESLTRTCFLATSVTVSPTRTVPASTTTLSPRRRAARPTGESTNRSASGPNRAENFEHRVRLRAHLEHHLADAEPAPGRQVLLAEVHVDVELVAGEWPSVDLARKHGDASRVHQRHLGLGRGFARIHRRRRRLGPTRSAPRPGPPARSPRVAARPSRACPPHAATPGCARARPAVPRDRTCQRLLLPGPRARPNVPSRHASLAPERHGRSGLLRARRGAGPAARSRRGARAPARIGPEPPRPLGGPWHACTAVFPT